MNCPFYFYRSSIVSQANSIVCFISGKGICLLTLSFCRYAIGIRQKGSNILKYAEIQSGQVLRVEPRAVSISYDATDVGASETALDREKLIAQNRRQSQTLLL